MISGGFSRTVAMLLAAQFLNVLIAPLALCQSSVPDPNCDRYQQLNVGTTYYIYNNEYPGYYRPSTACRWIALAPVGYKIRLYCSDILIPQSPNCQQDRMVVSLTGNADFTDGHNYCGTGTLDLTSTTTRMSIGLFAAYYSGGGKMSCTMNTVVDNVGPPITPKPPTCDCGWRQQRRIVGGTATAPNEYPFTAALIDLVKRELYCGSAIISEFYALTAAHCIKDRDPLKIGLLVGDHDISTGDDTNAAALYVLQTYTVHNLYNKDTHQNDIAVVKTQKSMQFSINVGPACLPFKIPNELFVGQSVTVLGWGTTEFSGPQSDILLAAGLTAISNTECQQRQNGMNTIFPSQVCTYQAGKDACQSDSGGPLIWLDNSINRFQLVGLVSYGMSCATAIPGVNTRITSYLSWIQSVTPGTTYCVK